MIYERESGRLIDAADYGNAQATFFYSHPLGKILVRLVASKACAKLNAFYNSTRLSAHKIAKLEQAYNIDSAEYDGKDFKSFNDFFTRKLKQAARPFSKAPTDFIAPADSKLLYQSLSPDLRMTIKGGRYSLGALVGDQALACEYANGACLAFRLSVDDYHRYVFPDNGTVLWSRAIDGKLHTVQPVAHRQARPYTNNYRILSRLRTEHFDDILFIEIGALLVGRINNHAKTTFRKGEEKGFFELGGSTIVILLKPGVIKVDKDIADYSQRDIETKVKQGETIGVGHA